MKEKKHRVEDALQATRAALEEGIVPGGGVALLEGDHCGQAATTSRTRTRRPARRSCCARSRKPLRQIAENAGLEGSVVVNDVRKAKKGWGLNAATNEIVRSRCRRCDRPRDGDALGASERRVRSPRTS